MSKMTVVKKKGARQGAGINLSGFIQLLAEDSED